MALGGGVALLRWLKDKQDQSNQQQRQGSGKDAPDPTTPSGLPWNQNTPSPYPGSVGGGGYGGQRQAMGPGRTRGGERGGRNPDSTTPDGGDLPTGPVKYPGQGPDSPAAPGTKVPVGGGTGAPAPNPLNGDMSKFLEMLSKQGNLDTASQAWQLQRAVQEYGEGRPIEDYLLSLYGGDVMGVDFNMPQNDASGWINQAMGGNYGSGPPGSGSNPNTNIPPGTYGAGAGLGAGDYAADQATRAAGDAAGERIGRYTESGRQKITQHQKSIRDALSEGQTLSSLGVQGGEGTGKVINSLWKKGGFYDAFGVMAQPTYDYRVVNGQLQMKPKANQTGRIASSGNGGKWQAAPANQQRSFERVQAFKQANPGLGAADFLADKELDSKKARGLLQQVPGSTDQNPVFVGRANTSYEGIYYDRNGHVINAPTQPYQTAGLEPGDYNPDYNGGDHGPLNADGTYADGTVYGGSGIPSGGIANQGSYTLRGASFDPNNPQAFALIAPQVQSIARDLDNQKRDLRNSTIQGGERDAALADATIGAYGAKAQARQGLVQDALGYMTNLSKEKKFGVPVGGYTGGAASGLQGLLSKYNTDTNYNLGKYGIDQASATADSQNNTALWGTIGGLLSKLFF